MHLWELHPALVHFPIAFLVAGVLLDLFAWKRQRVDLTGSATKLILAGVATGWLAGLAGIVAFFTVPAHTARAHDFMLIHFGLNVAALVVFSALAILRVRPPVGPSNAVRTVGAITLVVTLVAAYIGGMLVYRGGAGVDPTVLSPELTHTHEHGAEHVHDTPDTHP